MNIEKGIYTSVWKSVGYAARDSVYGSVDVLVDRSVGSSIYISGWNSVGGLVLDVFGGEFRTGIYNDLKNKIREYEY
jgi:hypothetical protein